MVKNKSKNNTNSTTDGIDFAQLDRMRAQLNVAFSMIQQEARACLDSGANGSLNDVPGIDENDDTLFPPQIPRLGLGAPIPAEYLDEEGKYNPSAATAQAKLRRQLLGAPKKGQMNRETSHPLQGKGRNGARRRREDDSESEEEAGRSALGKSKRDAPKRKPDVLENGKDGSEGDVDMLGDSNTANGEYLISSTETEMTDLATNDAGASSLSVSKTQISMTNGTSEAAKLSKKALKKQRKREREAAAAAAAGAGATPEASISIVTPTAPTTTATQSGTAPSEASDAKLAVSSTPQTGAQVQQENETRT